MRAASWGAAAAVAGGFLWIPFGFFEMLRPWGVDRAFQEDRGYEVVLDAALYRTYALPGALAATLTALGLLGLLARLALPATRVGRVARVLGWLAAGLGAVSAAGALLLFDPLFTGLRMLGTLALGAATVAAGLAARRVPPAAGWAGPLLALGLLGLALFPLWPVVYALAWLTPAAGAVTIGLFGLGWILVGARLAAVPAARADGHSNT